MVKLRTIETNGIFMHIVSSSVLFVILNIKESRIIVCNGKWKKSGSEPASCGPPANEENVI